MVTMLQVECVDSFNSTVLREGESYFAFPFGDGTAAYISRFPKQGSHMGAYQLTRFKVIEPTKEVKHDVIVPVNEPKQQATIHKFAYLTLTKRFITYGFVAENKVVALFADMNLTELIGTTDLANCEILDSIGKTPARKVFPKPITLIDLKVLTMQDTETSEQAIEFEQLSLF